MAMLRTWCVVKRAIQKALGLHTPPEPWVKISAVLLTRSKIARGATDDIGDIIKIIDFTLSCARHGDAPHGGGRALPRRAIGAAGA